MERNISKQLKRAGQKSKRIENKPTLKPSLQFFLDAFYELQTERVDGGLIPVTKVLIYCDSWKFPPQLKQRTVTLVRAMDLALLKDDQAKAEKAEKAAERGRKPANPSPKVRTSRR